MFNTVVSNYLSTKSFSNLETSHAKLGGLPVSYTVM